MSRIVYFGEDEDTVEYEPVTPTEVDEQLYRETPTAYTTEYDVSQQFIYDQGHLNSFKYKLCLYPNYTQNPKMPIETYEEQLAAVHPASESAIRDIMVYQGYIASRLMGYQPNNRYHGWALYNDRFSPSSSCRAITFDEEGNELADAQQKRRRYSFDSEGLERVRSRWAACKHLFDKEMKAVEDRRKAMVHKATEHLFTEHQPVVEPALEELWLTDEEQRAIDEHEAWRHDDQKRRPWLYDRPRSPNAEECMLVDESTEEDDLELLRCAEEMDPSSPSLLKSADANLKALREHYASKTCCIVIEDEDETTVAPKMEFDSSTVQIIKREDEADEEITRADYLLAQHTAAMEDVREAKLAKQKAKRQVRAMKRQIEESWLSVADRDATAYFEKRLKQLEKMADEKTDDYHKKIETADELEEAYEREAERYDYDRDAEIEAADEANKRAREEADELPNLD